VLACPFQRQKITDHINNVDATFYFFNSGLTDFHTAINSLLKQNNIFKTLKAIYILIININKKRSIYVLRPEYFVETNKIDLKTRIIKMKESFFEKA
jgi:hypothetical protein